ncbi:MAG: isoprenylcysteine carboxylmethyltransferase family protein [Bacteroidales bacterium]|nr:isoprenylcysteine carboxylmethyltransferase family protein [Bacteroidales bacterium]
MTTKKHHSHPHLTGEHKLGDIGQLILFFLFLGVWITDSFVFHYSTFLRDVIPDYVRIPVAGTVLIASWYMARRGMKEVFGTERGRPGVIRTGVFRVVRHPIYLGAILFYLGAIFITMSIASAAFWIMVIMFYILIARYEERILTEEFGDDYDSYKKDVGMLFPKLRRLKS